METVQEKLIADAELAKGAPLSDQEKADLSTDLRAIVYELVRRVEKLEAQSQT